jgi:glycosyltransferase involved in cell wall biosynthesis
MPLVSVIIPTHNRRQLLAEAVNSCLAQTFSDLEVIVVDDGSTDGTGELVRERYARDPRVRYIWQRNSERAFARNCGILAAKGDFVAFLDSDDVWLPNKLEKQMPLFAADPAVNLVHCGYTVVDDSGTKIRDLVHDKDVAGDIFHKMVYWNRVGSLTPVVRRSAIERAGMFCARTSLLTFEDWEFWTRICYHSRVAYVAESLALHRVHAGNTERSVSAASYSTFLDEVFRYVSAEDRPKVAEAAARRFMDLIQQSEQQGNLGEARRTVFAAMACVGPGFLWRHLLFNRRLLANVVLGRKAADSLRLILGRKRSP